MSSFLTEIAKIFEDELNANIIFLLDLFGPLNLQALVEILKKPKTTISDHLKKMLELSQIEIEENTTSKKKIFYKLTSEISDLINQEDDRVTLSNEIMDALDKKERENLVHSIANIQRTIGFQANLFSQLGAQYIEDNIHFFSDVEKNRKELRGFFNGMNELVIKNDKEYREIWGILTEFQDKLKKFDKSKRKKGKYRLMIFLLGVPLDKIEPSTRQEK
ncbi:MAG: ArsR family transcriptional regulator [Promethearchaeota archaeon]